MKKYKLHIAAIERFTERNHCDRGEIVIADVENTTRTFRFKRFLRVADQRKQQMIERLLFDE